MPERESADKECKLYEFSTYQRTAYLVRVLHDQLPLTKEDLTTLWEVFKEGAQDALGERWQDAMLLSDFIQWLTATGNFEGCVAAEVVW
jgi:hypothetical protein